MRRKYSSPHWPLRTLASATAVSFGCLLFGALWLINLSPTLAADPTVPTNVDSHFQRLIQRANNAAKANTNLPPQTFATPRSLAVTVGVLSDSFNTAYLNVQSPPATTAAQDVSTGDLPVVNVLEDFDNGGFGGTDEGRAMCQIVYDLAPRCNLAFATAFVSEIDFDNNIVALRAQANCDVIVYDIRDS